MFNQVPYMMASPMFQAAPLANGLSSLTAPASAVSAGTKAAGLLGKINWSSILSNAGKALNVANQAIPLYYQVKPVISNIKALGKIGKEFTKIDSQNINDSTRNFTNMVNNNSQSATSDIIKKNQDVPIPTFFL